MEFDQLIDAWMKERELGAAKTDRWIEGVDLHPADRERRATLLGALHLVFQGAEFEEEIPGFLPPRFRARAIEETVWWFENEPQRVDSTMLPLDVLRYLEGESRVRVLAVAMRAAAESSEGLLLLAEVLDAECEAAADAALRHGHAAFPEDPLPAATIARRLAGRADPPPTGDLSEALQWFERALVREPRLEFRGVILGDACETALRAEELDLARRWAEELLDCAQSVPPNWNRGNALYTGHSALGVLALRDGDEERACSELLSAGHCGGSPQLNSFGPEFGLANQLLRAGHCAAVVDFLRLVQTFWSMNEGRLAAWIDAIERGETPTLHRFR
ncbi:MAG: hypothetical protein AAGB93_03705 [Planctomycetota bacterium]